MLFDKEAWPIVREHTPCLYCGVVDNAVSVKPARKKEYYVHIKVPSDMFSYMRTVCKFSVDEAIAAPVELYLDEIGNQWVFYMLGPDNERVSLWGYKELPGWALPV